MNMPPIVSPQEWEAARQGLRRAFARGRLGQGV
jgi:hypothetical protein